MNYIIHCLMERGKKHKKVILFDIDETLVEKEAYPNNLSKIIYVINILKKYGYSFGLSTNRPLEPFVKKIVNTYKINNLVICEGGACVYKKILGFYILKRTLTKPNINKLLLKHFKNKNIQFTLNTKRIRTATIKLYNNTNKHRKEIIKSISKLECFKDLVIREYGEKIIIENKNIDKIKAINRLYQCEPIIFITDYEKNLSLPQNNVKIYSVGKDKEFNKKCHAVYSEATVGVLEILKKEGMKNEKL